MKACLNPLDHCVPFFFFFFFSFFSSHAPASSVIECTGKFRHYTHRRVPSSHAPASSVIECIGEFRHHMHRQIPSSHTGKFRNHMHRLTAFDGRGICFTACSSSSGNKCLSKPETVSLRDLFQMRIQELLERKQDVIWRHTVQ